MSSEDSEIEEQPAALPKKIEKKVQKNQPKELKFHKMSSEDSEIEEQQAAPPKKIEKKVQKNQPKELLEQKEESKKLTTKDMISQALTELKSRKGTSLYAIKKYMTDKYNVDTEKLNYVIKKSIKTGVETGLIVQTKGSGASGSFKLAPGKVKPEKKTTKKEPKTSIEKPTKPPKANVKPKKTKTTSNEKTVVQKTKEISTSGEGKKQKIKKASEKPTLVEGKIKKSKTTKIAKGLQTPSKKKAAMMKRKSIGSIIKPPKMNPKKM